MVWRLNIKMSEGAVRTLSGVALLLLAGWIFWIPGFFLKSSSPALSPTLQLLLKIFYVGKFLLLISIFIGLALEVASLWSGKMMQWRKSGWIFLGGWILLFLVTSFTPQLFQYFVMYSMLPLLIMIVIFPIMALLEGGRLCINSLRKKEVNPTRFICWVAWSMVWGAGCFVMMAIINSSYGTSAPHLISLWGLGWFCVMVWGTDIGAYVIGKCFKGPKLAPRVSPNKTWSGAIGGFVVGALAGVGYLYKTSVPFTSWSLFLVSTLLLAQGGDLCESAAKRFFGVKDSSQLIPGHGGLWDRLDSLLFVICGNTLLALLLPFLLQLFYDEHHIFF